MGSIPTLIYLNHYPHELHIQVQKLIDTKSLGEHLIQKYPSLHPYTTDKTLYDYVMELKNSYLRTGAPIAKVLYDTKLRDVHAALGTHTFVSRVQGGETQSQK